MAVQVASLEAVLTLEKNNFDGGLKEAEGSLNSFGGTLKGALATAGGFLAAQAISMGLSAITSTLSESISEARESIAINKQLEQVIRSTGGAAGVTADEARRLADELGRVTNFDDDAVLSGENLLLTFTKIGKDVFPRATETILDMSQALGQDLKSSAIQLGKALNDPLTGLTALKRVGVTFSDEQKAMIESLVGSNKSLQDLGDAASKAEASLPKLNGQLAVAQLRLKEMQEGGKASASSLLAQQNKIQELQIKIGAATGSIKGFNEAQKASNSGMSESSRLTKAQNIILDELQREFGGSAKALADPAIQLQNAFKNLQETFGTNVLLPVLNSLAQAALPALNAAIGAFKLTVSGLNEKEMTEISKMFVDLVGILATAMNAFNEIGKGIVAVARGLGLANENSTGLGITIKALVLVIGAFAEPLRVLGLALQGVGAALQVVGVFAKIVMTGFQLLGNAIGQAASQSSVIMAAWNTLASAGTTLYQILKIIQIAWENLINAMSQRIGLPPLVTPGSPTPLEMGLRGIASAINTMPPLNTAFGGSVPMAAGGGSSSVTNIHLGGQSFSFSGNNQQDQAMIAMLQFLRGQLAQ